MKIVPRPLRDACYDFVARRRRSRLAAPAPRQAMKRNKKA
jgi:predicted DCC family thiol-disulfide oxidoreductase YuxK